MSLRVTDFSKIKYFRYGIEAKASLNRARKLELVDAKLSDLHISRLKLR